MMSREEEGRAEVERRALDNVERRAKYEAPAVVCAEKVEARAAECIRAAIYDCSQGPVQS